MRYSEDDLFVCEFGDFEEVILGDESIKRLAGILNNKIKENEERKNSKL